MSLKRYSNIKTYYSFQVLKRVLKHMSDIITDDFRTKQEQFQEFQTKSIQESSWIQLLLTLKFWLDDVSPKFEKTDIYIEKSVNLSFELMDTPFRQPN
jgi:hypothetical protein